MPKKVARKELKDTIWESEWLEGRGRGSGGEVKGLRGGGGVEELQRVIIKVTSWLHACMAGNGSVLGLHAARRPSE